MRIWLVLVLAGCWTSSSPEPAHPVTETAPPPRPVRVERPPRDPVITAMERFRDQMCSCKDKACADGVQDDMTKWAMVQAREMRDRKANEMDDDAIQRMTSVTEDYGKCMMAAMTAGSGTP